VRRCSLSARRAVVDYAQDLSRKVAGVLRRAPDARDAELAAPTITVVVGTEDLSPRVAAADFDAPTRPLCAPEGLLNVLVGMPVSRHARRPVQASVVRVSCQVTTCRNHQYLPGGSRREQLDFRLERLEISPTDRSPPSGTSMPATAWAETSANPRWMRRHRCPPPARRPRSSMTKESSDLVVCVDNSDCRGSTTSGTGFRVECPLGEPMRHSTSNRCDNLPGAG